LEAISHRHEGVKKSTSHVIPSEARNLHLFVFKEINADASLSMTARFFHTFHDSGIFEWRGRRGVAAALPCSIG